MYIATMPMIQDKAPETAGGATSSNAQEAEVVRRTVQWQQCSGSSGDEASATAAAELPTRGDWKPIGATAITCNKKTAAPHAKGN